MQKLDWKKYVVVFAITFLIFVTVIYISSLIDKKRLESIQSIEDKIAIDILSSETQFNLLAESSCGDLNNSLSEELNSLSDKLSFTESNLGATDAEVVKLKRYYSLLQIKDYLLSKKISEKCGIKPLVIFYFYSNAGDCKECEEAGFVLTYLRNQYPELRVYAFDYNLDLSALQTLKSVIKIQNRLPAVVVNEKIYYGLKSIEEFEENIPEIKKLILESGRQKEETATPSGEIQSR